MVDAVLHDFDFHEALPSFRDQYRHIHDKVVYAAYRLVFSSTRQRYLTGGIATQFYIPAAKRRGSDDIDINDLKRMSLTKFRKAIDKDIEACEAQADLSGLGTFKIYSGITNHTLRMHICNWNTAAKDETKYFFNMSFPRYSANHHAKMLPLFEREYEHAPRFSVDTLTIPVLNPADIIIRKLVRSMNFTKWEEIPLFSPPKDIADHLAQIWKQREIIYQLTEQDNFDKLEYNHQRTVLRSICDSYDIRSLSEALNHNYFEEAMAETEKVRGNRKELENILKQIAPEI